MRRLSNYLRSSDLLSDRNSPRPFITVGPFNCDFPDLRSALENSLPGQRFHIYGGNHNGRLRILPNQSFFLFDQPSFIADPGEPLFYADYADSDLVIVRFIGSGTFGFNSPDISLDSHPNVNDFFLHIDLSASVFVSRNRNDILLNRIYSNFSFRDNFDPVLDDRSTKFSFFPYSSAFIHHSISTINSNHFFVVNRRENPSILELFCYESGTDLFNTNNFSAEIFVSTKLLALRN